MYTHRAAILIPVAATGLLLAGCGGNSGSDTAASAPESSMTMSSTSVVSSSGDIVISDFAFAVPAKVSPGQKITIRNNDTAEHSVTADSGGAFDVDVDGGKTAVLTVPATAGTYAFHCEYHPKMVGTLTVG